MGRACNAVFKGSIDPYNPYNWHISEYSERMRLKKLGFTSNYEELDSEKASVFIAIDIEFDRLREQKKKREEQKRKLRQGPSPSRRARGRR